MRNLLTHCSLLFALTTPVCFAATEAAQCELNGIDYKIATQFISQFKSALNKNDKISIAKHVSYPLRINTAPGKYYTIKNKKEFIAKYNTLFTAPLIKSLKSDSNIFCNYQGAMIGAGGIWFNTKQHHAHIFAINPSNDE